MPHLIETERLLIRPFLASDDEGMFIMDSDPEVHRYVGKTPLLNIEQSRGVIAFVQQQYIDNGIGRWVVTEKATGDFVGWTGFKLITERVNGHTGHYDFGYRLSRKFWGRGYATESGLAALQYGINTLHFKDIYAMTDVNNLASRRVLEKLGFRFIEIFNYDGEAGWRAAGEPATWYQFVQ